MLIAWLNERRKYKGFIVGKDRVHISILQYHLHSTVRWWYLLFCKYDEEMIENLKKTIEIFEWCSNQKVNWERSALCGINIEENKLISVAGKLNCKAEHLPFLYLGLPLGRYSKKVSFWQPVIEKLHVKFDKWRRYNLSRGGRATLCKFVLSNLPTYYMSSFLIP